MGTEGRLTARLRADGEGFREEAGHLDPEPFIGRVLEVLPEVVVEDFGDPYMRPEALRTPEAWREWLCEYTGNMAWAGDEQAPETNFMRRARPGDTTNGYTKTDRTCNGLAVWEKVAR